MQSCIRAAAPSRLLCVRNRCMSKQAAQSAPSPFRFAKFEISPDEVFATSKLSFAFVNLKPVVPGHVLVAPRRAEAARFADLTSEETQDLWCFFTLPPNKNAVDIGSIALHDCRLALVKRVSRGVEQHYAADALTVTLQDGPAAGQTVPHVHVHVLPRRWGDFDPNDKVYDAIDEASKSAKEDLQIRDGEKLNLDAERVVRTPQQMAQEAAQLRPLFEQL